MPWDQEAERLPATATDSVLAATLPEGLRWVDASIWTPSMVHALQRGVKGGRWYSLMDKVFSLASLRAAFASVKDNDGAPGIDHVTTEMFERDLERNLRNILDTLRDGTYRPSAARRCMIPKVGGGERPLGIPTVRDRVVQTALRNGLEPIFEREFAPHSYGYRPGRDAKKALQRVTDLLRGGAIWVVDVDFQSYFDSVPHAPLLDLLRARICDGRVLALVEVLLKQPVLEDGSLTIPQRGTPQGSALSALLANLYLHALDQEMASSGWEMTRYADDFVIQCRTEEEAQRALAQVQRWSAQAGLTLHPSKTRVAQTTSNAGFDFLGFHLRMQREDPTKTRRWPRQKSVSKLRAAISAVTHRTSGSSMSEILEWINRRLRGFFAYFRSGMLPGMNVIDQWIRGRLRSILRRRDGRRGHGRGADHQRWPNAYFDSLGLFSLVKARGEYVRSLKG